MFVCFGLSCSWSSFPSSCILLRNSVCICGSSCPFTPRFTFVSCFAIPCLFFLLFWGLHRSYWHTQRLHRYLLRIKKTVQEGLRPQPTYLRLSRLILRRITALLVLSYRPTPADLYLLLGRLYLSERRSSCSFSLTELPGAWFSQASVFVLVFYLLFFFLVFLGVLFGVPLYLWVFFLAPMLPHLLSSIFFLPALHPSSPLSFLDLVQLHPGVLGLHSFATVLDLFCCGCFVSFSFLRVSALLSGFSGYIHVFLICYYSFFWRRFRFRVAQLYGSGFWL